MATKFVKKESPGDGYLYTVSQVVNRKDNGGESIDFSVDVFDSGDVAHGLPKSIFQNVYLNLQCYGSHSTSIRFGGAEIGDLICTLESIGDIIMENLIKEKNEKSSKYNN